MVEIPGYLEEGPQIVADICEEWLSKIPRQQRRALIRESNKKGKGWLYKQLSSMKIRGEI